MPKKTAAEWKDDIHDAKNYKETFGNSGDWEIYRGYYRGHFPGFHTSNFHGGSSSIHADILPVNITYSNARTVIPNTYFRNPYITVTPRQKSGFEIHAKILESIDNWLIQEMGLKKTMRTGVLDTFLCGRSIFKIGYDSQFGFREKDILEELGINDATATQLARGNPESKEHIEYNINMKPGMPWVQRVDPDFFLVPFGVKELNEAEWVDHIIIRHLKDLKKDRKYKNTQNLTGTHIRHAFLKHNKSHFFHELAKTRDMEFIEIHEIHDAKYRDVAALVLNEEEKFIRGPEDDTLQIEGLPFVDMCWNEDPEFYWCPSDARIIEPQQLELNETRTQMMKHRRISILKFLVDGNAIDEDAISHMFSEGVGPVVRVNGNPASAVSILQPHIPPDLPAHADIIQRDVRQLVGLSSNQQGEFDQSSRRTATEASIVSQGSNIRADEKRDAMADAITEIMRKVNQVIFKYWDFPRVVQVVGFDAAIYWVKFRPSEIRGEFDLKIDVESLTPNSKQLKRSQLIQLIQAIGNNPNVNIDYLLRQLLREFEWLDLSRILPSSLDNEDHPEGIPLDEFSHIQRRLLTDQGFRQERVQGTVQQLGGNEKGLGGLGI